MTSPLLIMPLLATLWALCFTAIAHADSVAQPTIAIILDDMGVHRDRGEAAVKLPGPVTYAFLPFRKHTRSLATLAHRLNKEVMLHAPMQNNHNLPLGAGALTADMDRTEFTLTLRRALRSVPYVSGVNNHMGSALTRDGERMEWVMEELRRYPVYFVDSRTISSTIAGQTAIDYQVPSLTRDVFLDHERTPEAVARQFQQLLDVARVRGFAIGIGHPHQVTIDFLRDALPALDEQGIRLASVSSLWQVAGESDNLSPPPPNALAAPARRIRPYGAQWHSASLEFSAGSN